MQSTMRAQVSQLRAAPAARIVARRGAVAARALKKGDVAPAFTLPNQDGRAVAVKAGGKDKVVYFYPKDASPGCTIQAKAFRDANADLKKRGVEVFGVSADSVDSHAAFAEAQELPFALLADAGGKVAAEFGVKKDLLGLLPGRVTFVLDGKTNEVLAAYNNQFKPETHVAEVVKALESRPKAAKGGLGSFKLFG